jgi:hypothetical protein
MRQAVSTDISAPRLPARSASAYCDSARPAAPTRPASPHALVGSGESGHQSAQSLASATVCVTLHQPSAHPRSACYTGGAGCPPAHCIKHRIGGTHSARCTLPTPAAPGGSAVEGVAGAAEHMWLSRCPRSAVLETDQRAAMVCNGVPARSAPSTARRSPWVQIRHTRGIRSLRTVWRSRRQRAIHLAQGMDGSPGDLSACGMPLPGLSQAQSCNRHIAESITTPDRRLHCAACNALPEPPTRRLWACHGNGRIGRSALQRSARCAGGVVARSTVRRVGG